MRKVMETKKLTVWAFGFGPFGRRVGKRSEHDQLHARFGEPGFENLPIVTINCTARKQSKSTRPRRPVYYRGATSGRERS